MIVWIAEKPEVARLIANAIGVINKNNGYIECKNDNFVTWCFGHLLENKPPEYHNKSYANWKIEDLPILIYPPVSEVCKEKKAQVNIIGNLLSKADTVVNCGDIDDEGQKIVDDLIFFFDFEGEQKRALINDMNDDAVKKAISDLKNNKDYHSLYLRAFARSCADEIFGLNMTRAMTLYAREKGNNVKVLTIGRVQTPTLALITKRYSDFVSHKKSFYYVLNTVFENKFKSKHLVNENAPVDEKKRILEKNYLDEILTKIKKENGVICDIKNENKKVLPPLPYNLATLQQDMNNKFGYTADDVLKITQELREKHKAITYNRSDCSYLSDDQYLESPDILKSVLNNINPVHKKIDFNTSIKSKAFDSSKITAHTAIIPTKKMLDVNLLSEAQKNVYFAVCERFLIQFLPEKTYKSLIVTVNVKNELFQINQSKILDKGYTIIQKDDDDQACDDVLFNELSNYSINDVLSISSIDVDKKETKPKPLFTEATLLKALTSIADYVTDPKIKELLKLKDKDKKDERGSIGTPATRSGIIEKLKKSHYIIVKDKKLIPTENALKLINLLPETITNPDLTALWYEMQNEIANCDLTPTDFIKNIYQTIENQIDIIKKMDFNFSDTAESKPKLKCPKCEGNLFINEKNIRCKCGFYIQKTICGKVLTEKQLNDLIIKGKTSVIKNLLSKNGKKFNAMIALNADLNGIVFNFDK